MDLGGRYVKKAYTCVSVGRTYFSYPSNYIVHQIVEGERVLHRCSISERYFEGYRGWRLIHPNGEIWNLTEGEVVVDEFREQVRLLGIADTFSLSAPADDPDWAGAYSCYVESPSYRRERLACLTLIGECVS